MPYCFIAQDRTLGLIHYTDQADQGYTLMSNNESTYLIDACGYIVNEWISEYPAGQACYLRKDGSLLRAGLVDGAFNAGGAGGVFELFDWDGELLWSIRIADNMRQSHHDMALLPNGNFLCTVWELKSEAEAKEKGRIEDGAVWSEALLEIEILDNNQYDIVWRWSIWDHLIQDHNPSLENYGIISDHPEKMNINYIDGQQRVNEDWLHINAVDYNEALDQIAVSARNTSEIYIIDHSTTTEEAEGSIGGIYGKGGDILYRYGNPQAYNRGDESDRKLNKQHDIKWILSDDNKYDFSVFNNEYISNRQSAALLFRNPSSDGNYVYNNGFGDEEVFMSYTNPSLYSDILSGVQVLDNGNLLILEGRSGHLMEISAEEELVWEYIYPVNRNGGPGVQGARPRFNSLFRATRYASDYEGLADKILEPSVPIELSPIEDDCQSVVLSTLDRLPPSDDRSYFTNSNGGIGVINSTDHKWLITFTTIGGQVIYREVAKENVHYIPSYIFNDSNVVFGLINDLTTGETYSALLITDN